MSVGMLESFTHYWDDNWQDQCFITSGKEPSIDARVRAALRPTARPRKLSLGLLTSEEPVGDIDNP